MSSNPLDVQVGGEHYKNCTIQPVEFIEANELRFLEGCVVKRVTRHDKPTGKGRQDIEKAIHELQLLLSLRYSEQTPPVSQRDEKEFPLVAVWPAADTASETVNRLLAMAHPDIQVVSFSFPHQFPTPPQRMTWQDVAKLSAVHRVFVRTGTVGSVWLEVKPAPGDSDAMIVERGGVWFCAVYCDGHNGDV